MNYFELYEMLVSFSPDKDLVKKKFYELSKMYHPDRYTLADEDAQTEALQMAALNNMAYRTLQNDDATLQYVLKLKGVLEDDEKYNLPPDFLMEMMELNELVDEKNRLAISSWQQQNEVLEKELKELTTSYDRNHDESILLKIKDVYFRKKYLLRIQERIDTFAAH